MQFRQYHIHLKADSSLLGCQTECKDQYTCRNEDDSRAVISPQKLVKSPEKLST
jgi:hypothetical protein